MKKIILITLAFLFFSSLSGYLFHIFFQNPKNTIVSLDKAFIYFSIGKLDLSKNIVKDLSLSPKEKKFLTAVFLQQNKQFAKSNRIFNLILEKQMTPHSSKNLLLLEEILAMKILNHFFLDQTKELKRHLITFKNSFGKSSLLPLIEVIVNKEESTEEILKKISFAIHSYRTNSFNNSWFFYNLKQLVPERNLLLKKAHNLILVNKIDQARFILNKELEQIFQQSSIWQSDDYQHIMLLLALSYFYEIPENSENLFNYYDSIGFFLEKLNTCCKEMYKHYFSNDNFFSSCLNLVEHCPDTHLFVLAKNIFYHQTYSHISISEFIDRVFVSSSNTNNIHSWVNLLKQLDNISQEEKLYFVTFEKKALTIFKDYLKNNLTEEGNHFLHTFGKEFLELQPKFMEVMLKQIFLFGKDVHQLQQWLLSWESFLSKPLFKQFLIELFLLSKNFWLKGEQKQSLYLIELVLSKNNHCVLKQDITFFLENIYSQAKENRDISSLIYVEHLKNYYTLNIKSSITPEELANLTEDISYFYQQGNYFLVKSYCQWLLYLYPDSDKILEFLAKAFLEEKNYSEALKYFSSISKKNIDIDHCIFACQKLLKQQIS